jgi:hypothetical protein
MLTGWGTGGIGAKVWFSSYHSGYVAPNTNTNSTGIIYRPSIAIDLGYDGVGVGIPYISEAVGQTSTSVYTNGLTWNAFEPVSSLAPVCYVVYGAGGSAAANTADYIGIWAYAPTYSGG